jgi:hypothetical protein
MASMSLDARPRSVVALRLRNRLAYHFTCDAVDGGV